MSDIIAEHGKYAMLAGLTDVKGPGITIALNDKAGYDRVGRSD